MKESKMKFTRQFDRMDCGPACIRMVASACGMHSFTEKGFRDYCLPQFPLAVGRLIPTTSSSRVAA